MRKLLLLLFLSFTVNAFTQLLNYLPINGLIAYYPFNGNANDESGNGNDGTVNGPVLTKDRFLQSNNAYSFTQGTDLICTSTSYPPPTALTYSIWFKTSSLLGGQLIGFNSGQCIHGGQWDRTIWIDSNKIVFYTFSGEEVRQEANAMLIDSNWHHCVVTMDSNGSKIYVDGKLLSTSATQNTAENFQGYFRIGGLSPNDVNNSLIGTYDEVGIWNRALSEEEIALLYKNQGAIVLGNVGVNVTNPQRNFHINDVLRLEPRTAPPINPAEGDIYYDATLKKLRVFDGTTWQNCW